MKRAQGGSWSRPRCRHGGGGRRDERQVVLLGAAARQRALEGVGILGGRQMKLADWTTRRCGVAPLRARTSVERSGMRVASRGRGLDVQWETRWWWWVVDTGDVGGAGERRREAECFLCN